MSKLKKIIETIVTFLVVMIGICFAFALYKVWIGDILPQDIFNETGLYFLYTIGYGALEGDSVIQNVLAMVGIVALALMTTFLTIKLFWRLDDVKLLSDVLWEDDALKIQFQNNGGSICDMKATFTLYDEDKMENVGEPKEYYMPVLVKNSVWNLKMDLNETFWYRAVYRLLTSSDVKLYCLFSFVDTKSGQSSIKVEEIKRENLKMQNRLFQYRDFIKPVCFSWKGLLPIENGGHLDLIEKENSVLCQYHFTKRSSLSSFVMVYYNFHDWPLNLEKYNRDTTYLEMTFKADGIVNLALEIKLAQGSIIRRSISLVKGTTKYKLYLSEIVENIEEVREICYTLFKADNELQGSFEIESLVIVTR